jgi:hypothetical protein
MSAGVAGKCRRLRLGAARKDELLDTLTQDVEWLTAHRVMDYSLLVGICGMRGDAASLRKALADLHGATNEHDRHRLYSLWSPSIETETEAGGDLMREGMEGEQVAQAFLLGICDVLQEYNTFKRLETFVKTRMYSIEGIDPKGLSVVDPERYGKRFLRFVQEHTS